MKKNYSTEETAKPNPADSPYPPMLPCPFCGDESVTPCQSFPGSQFAVMCMECQAIGPWHNDQDSAIQTWNTRNLNQSLQDEIGKFRKVVDEYFSGNPSFPWLDVRASLNDLSDFLDSLPNQTKP